MNKKTSVNSIEYLVKFVTEEQYAEDFLDGKLFMHTAAYYHDQEKRYGAGRGDLREGAIFPNLAVYKNINFPVYCMYTVMRNNVKENTIRVPKQVIQDFGCEKGYAVVTAFSEFDCALATCETYGYSLISGKVLYGAPSEELIVKMILSKDIDNLFIKNPYFSHQKEYRLVVCKAIKPSVHLEEIDGVLVNVVGEKDYPGIIYQIRKDLRSFSRKFSLANLPQDDKNYLLKLW